MIISMKNIIRMFRYIPGEKLRIFSIIVFSIVGGLVNTIIPILFKNLINQISDAVTKNNFASIYKVLFLIISIFLVEQVILFFKEKVSDTFRMHVMTKLRLAVYPKILSLDIAYTEKHQPGSILQKINQGIGEFVNWLFNLSEWVGTVLTTTLFILLVLWSRSIWLGLIYTFTVVVMIYLTKIKTIKQKPFMKKANIYMEKFSGILSQTLSHLETIKTMSAEKVTSNKFRKTNELVKSERLKQFTVQRRYNFLRDFIGAIGVGLGLLCTVYLISKNSFSLGDIFLVALYSRTLMNSIQPLGYLVQHTSEVNFTSSRLIDFLETEPIIIDSKDAVKLDRLNSFVFKNVTYDYPEGKKGAVKSVSFDLDSNKTIALVGPSGVGKSTLTKLMLRFYEPTKGTIQINNKDISAYLQNNIRQRIGVVMQDVALFNASILENLQIANSNASKEQIIKAARQANAHEFIKELPKDYSTLVGERGVKLSGGQKQRIAIARAILKDPDLIILDEATSALDSESERLVQAGLSELLKGRSALIIAHRLSTVMHADEILVLQKGTVVERGTHQELMKYGGLYKKLFEMQSASGKIKL